MIHSGASRTEVRGGLEWRGSFLVCGQERETPDAISPVWGTQERFLFGREDLCLRSS